MRKAKDSPIPGHISARYLSSRKTQASIRVIFSLASIIGMLAISPVY